MKVRIIDLMMLMMVMFVMSACNNEEGVNIDGDENFPEMSEDFLERTIATTELLDNIKENSILEYQKWMNNRIRSNYECFHNIDEIEESPYSSNISLLPKINWEKQTLVIIYIHANSGLDDIHCNIYRKSNKYLIDCMTDCSFTDIETSRGVAIVLNEANLSKKNIRFNLQEKEEEEQL